MIKLDFFLAFANVFFYNYSKKKDVIHPQANSTKVS